MAPLTELEQCTQPADGAAGDEDEDDRDDGDDDEDDGRPDVAQLQRVQLGVAVSLKRVKGSITASFSRLSIKLTRMLNLSFASNSSASLMNFRHSEMGSFSISSTEPLNLLARPTHVKRHPILVVGLPGHVFEDGYCPVDYRSQWLIKKLPSM